MPALGTPRLPAADLLTRGYNTATGSCRWRNVLSRRETGATWPGSVAVGHLYPSIIGTYYRPVPDHPRNTPRHPTKGTPLENKGGLFPLVGLTWVSFLGWSVLGRVVAKDSLVPYQAIQALTSPQPGRTRLLTVAAVS